MSLERVSIVQRLAWIANIIYHQATAVVVVYILNMILSYYEIDSRSTWHKILSPLGFLLFTLEGLVLYTDSNVFTISLQRTDKVLIHKILSAIGSILITVGVSLIISVKGSHFTTAHGITGLIFLVCIWSTAILGIIMSQFPKIKLISPVWIKLAHFILGICVVSLGVASIGLGLYKPGFRVFSNDNTVIGVISVCGVLGIWALFDTVKSIYYLFA